MPIRAQVALDIRDLNKRLYVKSRDIKSCSMGLAESKVMADSETRLRPFISGLL